MEGETKSITCTQLPARFIIDKQEAKKFFIQFGSIKSFILKPSRCECRIEYETAESAQKALNAEVDFEIVATKLENTKNTEDFIDPDVQSELDSMLPVGSSKSALKQS